MRELAFRPIDYRYPDPLANDAAQLVLSELYNSDIIPNAALQYAEHSRWYKNYCVEDDAGIVAAGSLDIRRIGKGSVWLEGIVVSPDVRGQGVGRFLVGKLEDSVADMGGGIIEVTSRKTATKFYEKCGYERTGPRSLFLRKQVMPKDIPSGILTV